MRPHAKILGALAVESGVVTRAALERALREQEATGERLGEALVRTGGCDDEGIAGVLATQLNLTHQSPPLRPDPAAVRLVAARLARARLVLPLRLGPKSLSLAMADPLDLSTADDVRFLTGRRVEPVVVARQALLDGLNLAYGPKPTPRGGPEVRAPSGGPDGARPAPPATARQDPSDPQDRGLLEDAAKAAPIVMLVDDLLQRAAREGASDIHVEGGGESLHIRYRIDGVLRLASTVSMASHGPVISRLKIMAGMDISVKRRPQDGGLSIDCDGRSLRLRVSTLPTSRGEKAVIRILDPDRAPQGLGELGLSETDLARLRRLLRGGQGVILSAGPTGSGKSSTLFGALTEIDVTGQNVVTLEDPVEYRVAGMNQVQVNPQAGLTFPAVLRSVLRQDPDVVMVGEIRDRETAEIAMTAAVTGHMVLSTIHTIDAPGGITRLLNMGVPPFLVAGGLVGIVAQRLVRRVCPGCQGHSGGCPDCSDGYRGRTGVFQVMVMTEALRDAVVRGAGTGAFRRLAEEAGMGAIADDARRKVAEGETTPHEVSRVLQFDPGEGLPCAGCERGVPPGAMGCPHCGRLRRRECPCGTVLRSNWRFCPACLRKA